MHTPLTEVQDLSQPLFSDDPFAHLTRKKSGGTFSRRDFLELIDVAINAERARMQLAEQVRLQAAKIERLENLFKKGVTAAQFCKGLNGVNAKQVNRFLKARNWLYNESRSAVRWRVTSYARDSYMTEHQVEITPHGKEPFICYTPVLLRKGAVRLYEMYMNGELPMKKNWDGSFSHDKADREDA